MNHLTRREQLVLAGVLAMLLVGLAVKWYRTARSPLGISSEHNR